MIIFKLGGVSTSRAYHLYTAFYYVFGILAVYWLMIVGGAPSPLQCWPTGFARSGSLRAISVLCWQTFAWWPILAIALFAVVSFVIGNKRRDRAWPLFCGGAAW